VNYRAVFQAYFVSDIHLKGPEDRKFQVLLNFLKALPSDATHLFFMGDIFDLWVGEHQYFIQVYDPILTEVQKLQKQGVEIHYFEGNHDFHLRTYWQEELKVHVHEGVHHIQLGNCILRLEHGDLTNPDDLNYLRLRKFLRSKPMEWIIKNAPEKLVTFVGENWSQRSRKARPYVNEKVKLRARQYAIEAASQTPFDLMVCGHTHMQDEFRFEFNGRQHLYINLGTWLATPHCLAIKSLVSQAGSLSDLQIEFKNI